MNIKITTFTSLFSFFCVTEDYSEHANFRLKNQIDVNKILFTKTNNISDFKHGQYMAVMWKNKWTGVVLMEKQVLIWLITCGIFLRPNEKTFFIDLPLEYKKIQTTKVFEASIHGVIPVDKILSEDCQIQNEVATTWTEDCIVKSQHLIKNSLRTYFQPIALLTKMYNHVVIGDLLLEIQGKGIVNIIDELKLWPVFLERHQEAYITINYNILYEHKLSYFSELYVSRRRHRCCLLPEIPDYNLPAITSHITLEEYQVILTLQPKIENLFETESLFEDGSTVLEYTRQEKDRSAYKITPYDIEKYSNSYVTLNGHEYNVLSILMNKAKYLNICERYKDYDHKSVGRGISYRQSSICY